jgi:hypothetical protein
VLLLVSGPVRAAGGAHIVDDAAINDPGHCHIDLWYAHLRDDFGTGSAMVAVPGCTPRALPDVEIDGSLQHYRSPAGLATAIAIGPKLQLRNESTGLGIAVSASTSVGLDAGRFETASIVMPVTVPVNDWLRVNINMGWQWARATDLDAPFGGAQAEIKVAPQLMWMVEGFGHTTGHAGWQTGLRWTPGKGNIDFDMLGGSFTDGASATALTFGMTVQF